MTKTRFKPKSSNSELLKETQFCTVEVFDICGHFGLVRVEGKSAALGFLECKKGLFRTYMECGFLSRYRKHCKLVYNPDSVASHPILSDIAGS